MGKVLIALHRLGPSKLVPNKGGHSEPEIGRVRGHPNVYIRFECGLLPDEFDSTIDIRADDWIWKRSPAHIPQDAKALQGSRLRFVGNSRSAVGVPVLRELTQLADRSFNGAHRDLSIT